MDLCHLDRGSHNPTFWGLKKTMVPTWDDPPSWDLWGGNSVTFGAAETHPKRCVTVLGRYNVWHFCCSLFLIFHSKEHNFSKLLNWYTMVSEDFQNQRLTCTCSCRNGINWKKRGFAMLHHLVEGGDLTILGHPLEKTYTIHWIQSQTCWVIPPSKASSL